MELSITYVLEVLLHEFIYCNSLGRDRLRKSVGTKISSRLLVTTSTGAVQLWTQGELQWVREESLANAVVAEFAELPEQIASESSFR